MVEVRFDSFEIMTNLKFHLFLGHPKGLLIYSYKFKLFNKFQVGHFLPVTKIWSPSRSM